MRPAIVLAVLVLALAGAPAGAQEKAAPADKPAADTAAPDRPAADTPARPVIVEGSRVQLEYTLKDDRGEVLDSNRGRDPLTYTQGRQQLITGLETALGGLRAGDEKQVTVKPEDAYGAVDPKAELEVARSRVPSDVTVGTELAARGGGGNVQVVRVKEIRDATVVLDLNHPLAGKTLHFDVKVLDVQPPVK